MAQLTYLYEPGTTHRKSGGQPVYIISVTYDDDGMITYFVHFSENQGNTTIGEPALTAWLNG